MGHYPLLRHSRFHSFVRAAKPNSIKNKKMIYIGGWEVLDVENRILDDRNMI
jgi:hypothetical protein